MQDRPKTSQIDLQTDQQPTCQAFAIIKDPFIPLVNGNVQCTVKRNLTFWNEKTSVNVIPTGQMGTT